MNKKTSLSASINQQISSWFTNVGKHEVVNIVEVVEKAKAYLLAAESIPEEKVKQFVDNLRYDLLEFYRQYQTEAQHSVYLGLLNESFWSSLVEVTDKSQVEWAELSDDFEHGGEYHTGDYIGFGELECLECQHSQLITHHSEVTDCINCGANTFLRKPLAP